MTSARLGAIVWIAFGLEFLLLLELPAVFHIVPWPTLSTEIADGEKAWHPFAAFLLAVFFVGALHIVFRLSPLPLIVVSAGTAAGLALHFVR